MSQAKVKTLIFTRVNYETTDNFFMKDKNAFVTNGCKELEIDVHRVRLPSYLI